MKNGFTSCLLMVLMCLMSLNAWALVQTGGVYQIGTADELAEFATLVNTTDNKASAALTADIDYTGKSVRIGAGSVKWYGTLDGQGHSVTIKLTGTEHGTALVKNNYGKVMNLCVKGEITSGYKANGGVVAYNYGVVDHCISLVTITSSLSGDCTSGGLCGQSYVGGALLNSVFAGAIKGATATNIGGLIGWTNGATAVANCLMVGEIDINMNSSSSSIGRNPNNVKVGKNVYYVAPDGATWAVNAGSVEVTAEQVASGELAYKLGMNQQIGVDAYPTPLPTSPKVYATGGTCDGTGAVFTNTVTASAHTWNGYKCTTCGALNTEFVTPTDGVYNIGTVQQLTWLAEMVKAGNVNMNVKLTADIDMNGVADFPMIGTEEYCYRGIFDGQYHVIDNFVISQPTASNVGLFSAIAGGSVVKNLTLGENCSILGKIHVGMIGHSRGAGYVGFEALGNKGVVAATPTDDGGSSDAGVGGIVGNCNDGGIGYLDRCWFVGSIPSGTSAAQISGWCGSNQFTVKGCWSISDVPTGIAADKSFFRQGSGTVVTNCAQLNGTQVEQITAEDVAGGGLAWIINGKSGEQPVWFQKLGTDAIPTLTGTDVVYQIGTKNCDGSTGSGFGYSNENSGFIQVPHVLGENGLCTVCGQPDKDKDGYLLVSKPAVLKWIADQVNSGNVKQNFRLTADLDLSDYNPWEPIGNDTYKFNGNMDGGKHVISNMTVADETNNCAGLFGTVLAGNFSDLVIDASCSVTGVKYCGGLIGHTSGAEVVNITRVGTMCDVTCSGEAAAGINGNANAGSVCNMTACWTTGKISASKDAAAFSGWEGNVGAKMTNCWSTCEIVGYQDAAHYLARHGNSFTITNCYGPAPSTQGGLKNISADGLADGALCYVLNGNQKTIAWYQNLGDAADATPVPWNTHNQVKYVGAAGYATMVADADCAIQGSVKAYIGAKNNESGMIKLTEIADVPAGAAVILKGTYYNKVAATATADVSTNELKAATEAITADGTQYVLAQADGLIGFYKAEAGTTIPAGKGYFQSTAGVKAFFFGEADDATGISQLNAQSSQPIYNLAGQRLQKMQKGINIVNGKKVMY